MALKRVRPLGHDLNDSMFYNIYTMLLGNYNTGNFIFHRVLKDGQIYASMDHFSYVMQHPNEPENKWQKCFNSQVNKFKERDLIIYKIVFEPEFDYEIVDHINMDIFLQNEDEHLALWNKQANI